MVVVTNFFMKVFLMIQLSQIYLKDLPNLRDGLMSILIGIAARKSIDSNHPVRIDDLIKFWKDLTPEMLA